MNNSKITKLAKIIVNHSTHLKRGENILIEAVDVPEDVVVAIIREAERVGATPFVTMKSNRILREVYNNASEKSMKVIGKWEAARMKEMDAYVGIRGSHNTSEFSDVPSEKMKLYQTHWLDPVHFKIRTKKKWVIMRWPYPAMAQQAGMSSEVFQNLYFKVCTLDYRKMEKNMGALESRMLKTDKVRIVGKETNLEFSIKGIPVVKCAGEANLPDGEVFTAPVKNSINGIIKHTVPTIYQGIQHSDVRLEFKNGKIIKATSSKTKELNKVLDTDGGARYVGEFSFGLNPHIKKPMMDILFDEKIAGSFHLTPGNCYEEASNGNKSKIHWDMVSVQTKEFGGGEIYFDDVLIRKNGRFVTKDLEKCNPEYLK